jgi:pyruvate formate lyase activating enzyme
VCIFDALALSGRTASAAEVMAEVDKDAMYYKNSGGGVTFSGGEPLLQADFLVKLLEECKKRGYHCAIETAGNVEWNAFLKVLPYTDLFLYDVKLLDESRHIEATGAGNKRILENLRRLSEEGRVIWVRTPVIPGVNDDKAELAAISAYVSSLKTVEKYELLPYHSLGESKYGLLGRR